MITVDWGTKIINIPKADLTVVAGTLYELDTNQLRLTLKGLEDDDDGMAFERITRHNTEVTVAGVTYARTIEIINNYKLKFEDGQYSVRLTGSNNNFFDIQNNILVQNQVQVIPTNSAGLQSVVSGSGVTEQDKVDIANEVWSTSATNPVVGSFGEVLSLIEVDVTNILNVITEVKKYDSNRTKIDENTFTLTVFDDDNTTPIKVFNLKDRNGLASFTEIFERVPV